MASQIDIAQHRTRAPSLFAGLAAQPADALLALIDLHRADPRVDKIDLGVGVYRDESGATPIMRAVKLAERRLLETQASKSYLGADGDTRFTQLLAREVLGEALAASPRLTGVQTAGGTGALRIGAELAQRAALTGGHSPRVWLGDPSWVNHAQIFAAAGLPVRKHRFYDAATRTLDFDGMVDDLRHARAGDIVLLHGCCHNPTGVGFSAEQWRVLTDLVTRRGLIPFIDMAYQGLGDGWDADAAGARAMLDAADEVMLAYSCDKNFAFYRDRVGAFWLKSARPDDVRIAHGNIVAIARCLWSMPPDHGAATVRIVLDDPVLRADWQAELDHMRGRINHLRTLLAAAHPALSPIGEQRGLFAMLPVNAEAVETLRRDNGIYMASSGRINIAGLRTDQVPTLVEALRPHLPS